MKDDSLKIKLGYSDNFLKFAQRAFKSHKIVVLVRNIVLFKNIIVLWRRGEESKSKSKKGLICSCSYSSDEKISKIATRFSVI